MKTMLRISVILAGLTTIWIASAVRSRGEARTYLSTDSGQASPTSALHRGAVSDVITLRDAFVRQIESLSYKPSLAPPQIVFDNPPEFGSYDAQKNILHIADWEGLRPEQRTIFEQVASSSNGKMNAEAVFERSLQWIATHELGHWWQACQQKLGESHFATERGANRIAGAYWRMRDASLVEWIGQTAGNSIKMFPNPVPQGQNAAAYFDANYGALQPPALFWYQNQMIVDVLKEQPPPSFRAALQQPTFP